jgi:hypothetical protein
VRPLSSDTTHEVAFFKRHRDDDAEQSSPGLNALLGFPTKVRARLLATLAAVAKAPPKRFAGGGQWEAMHGEMTGYFEVRVTSKTPNGKDSVPWGGGLRIGVCSRVVISESC